MEETIDVEILNRHRLLSSEEDLIGYRAHVPHRNTTYKGTKIVPRSMHSDAARYGIAAEISNEYY